MDVYSAFSHLLAGQLVAACERRKVPHPALREGIEILRGWSGQMEADQAAPFIVTLAFQHLRKAAAEQAAPGKAALYDSLMATTALVSDLADLDNSLACLVAGQSGHILSPHYKDQWEAYRAGRAYSLQYRNVITKRALVVEPER
jgi:acyl-homoserine lactone acylase PvdQ